MLNATPLTAAPTKLPPKPLAMRPIDNTTPKRPTRLLVLHGPTPRQPRPSRDHGYGQGMPLCRHIRAAIQIPIADLPHPVTPADDVEFL